MKPRKALNANRIRKREAKEAARRKYQRNYGKYVYVALDLKACEAHIYSSCQKMYDSLLTEYPHLHELKHFRENCKKSYYQILDPDNETAYLCTREKIL
jgi:hypothetical protein